MDIHGVPTYYLVVEPESMKPKPMAPSDYIKPIRWNTALGPLPDYLYPTPGDAVAAAVKVWTAISDTHHAAWTDQNKAGGRIDMATFQQYQDAMKALAILTARDGSVASQGR